MQPNLQFLHLCTVYTVSSHLSKTEQLGFFCLNPLPVHTPVCKTSTFQASYFEVNKAVKIKIYNSGNDHYIDEDEEERTVISRWAQRKVAPQFNEELLDGCNKQHRQIHEKSLPHYFNSKGGQKFEYQPKPKPVFTPKPEKAKIT